MKNQYKTVNGKSRRPFLHRPFRKTPLAAAVACLCGIGAAHADKLEEVVVTASGRQESVQDIPYNISAVTAEDLDKAAVTDISGLARQIPGMVYNDMGARSNGVNNPIVLRGLNGTAVGSNNKSPAAGDQTVSIYLNATPLFANLKIKDVERVEVLRGPQGTLYGSGSVGGTVRFIYNRPDPTKFSGSFDTKVGQTKDSDTLSYAADTVLNIPLGETAALRIGSGYDYKAGVIDAKNHMVLDSNGNPVLANPGDYFNSPGVFRSQKDVDDAKTSYLRAALLWNLSDTTSALFTYHRQDDHADDFSGQNVVGKDRENRRYRTSPISISTDLYSMELTNDLGFATLTSASSYTNTIMNSETDNTNYGIKLKGYYGGDPRASALDGIDYNTDNFTQEFRLASNAGGAWDWVAGAYYSNYEQKSKIRSKVIGWSQFANTPGNPTAVAETGNAAASWADYYQTLYPDATFNNDVTFYLDKDITYKNKALFGELTRHITPAWQVTAGTRIFWVNNSRRSVQTIPYNGVAANFDATNKSNDSDQIFKLNTSYDLTENHKIYATWAEGYRQGGSNALPQTGPQKEDSSLIPYDSDFATNWEIGMKGFALDRINYSVALFRVDWKKIQIQVPSPVNGIPSIVNGGDAQSEGAELEAHTNLTENLDLTIGYTYTKAELTEDTQIRSGFNGLKGDRLPGVPKHTAMVALNYTQPLAAGASQILYHVDGSYRSSANTALNETARNFYALDGFDTWNASITWSNDTYKVGMFVNNITDELGVTAVDIANDTTPSSRPGSLLFTQTPRTIGLNAGIKF